MCNNAQILVSVTFTGLTGGNQAAGFIGGRWGTSASGITNGSTVTGGVHLPGIYDLVAIEYDPATGVASKILIQRDVVIAADTSGITADFANGVAMVSRTVNVTGDNGANGAWGGVEIQTKNGTWVDYSFTPNGAAILPPASAMVAGEVFLLTAGYDVSAGHTAIASTTIDATVDPGNTTTLDPSAVAALSGVTVSAGTHPTISGLSYTKAASSPTFQDFAFGLGGVSTGRNIEITALWLGTATTYTVPDFTGIGTWDPAWELATGVTAFDAWAEMDNNGYLLWTTGGNDSPGNSGAAASTSANVTLKPTLSGPKSPIRLK